MRDDIHLHWFDYHSYSALRGEIMTGQLPKVISQSEMQIVPGLTITVMFLITESELFLLKICAEPVNG